MAPFSQLWDSTNARPLSGNQGSIISVLFCSSFTCEKVKCIAFNYMQITTILTLKFAGNVDPSGSRQMPYFVITSWPNFRLPSCTLGSDAFLSHPNPLAEYDYSQEIAQISGDICNWLSSLERIHRSDNPALWTSKCQSTIRHMTRSV